jgi:tetrahydromethanopterin S-methyltransferase subunit A
MEPENNLEYSKLLKLLNSKTDDPSTVYEELIKKEDRVLDVVNRVVNYSNEKQVKSEEFMNLSLNHIVARLFTVIKAIMSEIMLVRNFNQFMDVVTKEDDRKIYVGLFFIILAVFIFFIVISS